MLKRLLQDRIGDRIGELNDNVEKHRDPSYIKNLGQLYTFVGRQGLRFLRDTLFASSIARRAAPIKQPRSATSA